MTVRRGENLKGGCRSSGLSGKWLWWCLFGQKKIGWIESPEQADQISLLMTVLSPMGRSDCPDWGRLRVGWIWSALLGLAI